MTLIYENLFLFLSLLKYLMVQYIFFPRQLILCYHKAVLEGNRSNYPDKYKITDALPRVARLAMLMGGSVAGPSSLQTS